MPGEPRGQWNDKAIDGLADTVKATAAVPMEVATLKQQVEGLKQTVDRNQTDNTSDLHEMRGEMRDGFKRLSDRLWQGTITIGGALLVGVILQAVQRL